MTPIPDSLQFAPYFDVAVRSAAGARADTWLENQDNFLLIDTTGRAAFLNGQQHLSNWPAGHIRLAVLDGMGGHGHGREAAEAVVAGLLQIPACGSLDALSDHLDRLHAHLQQVFAVGSDPAKRPGTTLTLLELPPGQAAMLYHVGDSRLYQVTGDAVTPLTVDHVPATAYAMEGMLDELEWWQQVHGEHRSQISQAFILGNAFDDPTQLSDPLYALTPATLPPFLAHLPDRRILTLDPDARYVLATDGFWACPAPQAWLQRWTQLSSGTAAQMVDCLFEEIASNPPPALHPDNITAIVLRPAGEIAYALPSHAQAATS